MKSSPVLLSYFMAGGAGPQAAVRSSMSKVIMKGTDAYDRLRERQTVAKFMIVMCVYDGECV